jgi:hypothetical protein
MKYMETVREIARGDGQWLKYDQKFRKSKCQLRVSWDNMHQELWLKACLIQSCQHLLAECNLLQTYHLCVYLHGS